CDCNGLADSCVYDENLGYGRCENCKRNTAGPKCERCRDNFFRLTSSDDCQACKCDPVGSVSLQCDPTGQCTCKPGVTGVKCDKCQANYFGFSQTGCRPCQCSPEGTDPSNTQCNEKGECSCKRNVIGAKCTQCNTGFYGLESSNPHGCRQCFCYGHSSVCQEAVGYTGRNISNQFRSGLDGWTVVNEQGTDVTEQYAVHHPGDSEDSHISVTAVGNEVLYVSAPAIFLGDVRSSYGQLFGFSFRVASTEGVQVEPGDIILEGENGLKVSARLNAQNNPIPTTTFQNYVFRLHEDPSLGWEPILRGFDFQKLLTSLKAIKIRMNYAPQGTGLIKNVFLESAIYDPRSPFRVNWVEECSCPAPYTGDHCEQCSVGYTRMKGSDDEYGQCIPCQCYGHSESCDPVTGVCNCQDNTVGDNCDACKDGYYGNPTEGTKDDCKPCPCEFGSRCILIGQNVVCTDCPEGHTGNLCEYCQDGYYGDPSGLLGSPSGCQKCNCSGNIDVNAIGNCNSLTGDCLKCIYNTRNGPLERCELCAIGFYGNATEYPKPQCIACDCYNQGTVTPPGHNPEDPLPCDDKGKCACLENVIGDKCDSCQDTYWNVGSGFGCEECLCDPMGSLNNSCDVITGQCPCKPGVTGRTCDQCQLDHYGYSDKGCEPCNCNPEGSLNVSCNEYGECSCKFGVLGIKCDSCEENKHNLTAGCISKYC
ncbi:LOW QUALITY PROTEIN: laminin subunit gamma-1-like, partial [Oculina patagonica]